MSLVQSTTTLLLEELRERGDVGRRALASVTGKLIFASAVAPELR